MNPPYKLFENAFPHKMICLLGILLWFSGTEVLASIPAQDSIPVKHAVAAAQLCQDKKFEDAKQEIALAVMSDSEKEDVYTWYIRGFIFKEIYKNHESADRNSAARDEAVTSFLHSKKLVTVQGNQYNNDAALKYLASTYYNDAIRSASDFTQLTSAESEDLISHYALIMHRIEPATDLSQNEKEFYRIRANRFYELWMAEPCTKKLNEEALNNFMKAFLIDNRDCDVIYNMAITHYNIETEARKPESACYSAEESKPHFEEAARLLHEAEAVCPDRTEVISALLNISRVANNEADIMKYQDRLDQLSGKTSPRKD